MLEKGIQLKTTTLLTFFLWLAVFEKLKNNKLTDQLEKCGLSSDFQYDFRTSWSTTDLLTVVSDRIAKVFNRSETTQAVALDISKDFDRVWCAGLLQKRKSGILDQIFGLILSFLCNRWLWVVLDEKSSQEYPLNAGVPKVFILGPILFLLHINDLSDTVICNIAIYTDDTTRVFQIAFRGGRDSLQLGDGRFCLGGIFHWVARTRGGVILTIWTFFKAKNNILKLININ